MRKQVVLQLANKQKQPIVKKSTSRLPSISPKLEASPVQLVKFSNQNIYIKRDDLLNQYFSGNKARKLAYFLDNDFPNITKIVGYGSVQANSLYSLAALAKIKGWQLDFYIQRLPSWLKESPTGNYAGALELGANIIEVDLTIDNLDSYMRNMIIALSDNCLFIPEGGRCQLAQHGIKQLAIELKQFSKASNLNNPVVMLPSGTGTTALFLQANLPFKVLTCACVGGDDYLKTQFYELEEDSSQWPIILSTPKKYHFGKLYPEFYQIWKKLNNQTQIEFDLLYDPLGWLTVLDHLKTTKAKQDIIYIHQGGIVGNQSMLPRYQRKYQYI